MLRKIEGNDSYKNSVHEMSFLIISTVLELTSKSDFCFRLKLPAKMMIVRSYTARSEDEISVSAGDGVIVLDCSKNENYLVYKPSSGIIR